MQVGDEVELRGDRQVNNTVVKAVNQAERTVKVLDSNEWLSLHDMFSLACFGTHDRSPEWAKVDNEGFKEPPIPPPPTQRVLLHPSLADATDDETSVKQVRVFESESTKLLQRSPSPRVGGFQELAQCGYSPDGVDAALTSAESDATTAAFLLEQTARQRRPHDAERPELFRLPPPSTPPPRVMCRALTLGHFNTQQHGEVELRCTPTALSVTMWVRLSSLPRTSACIAQQAAVTTFVHPLPVGTLVEGRYSQGSSPWYPGRIAAINKNGSYHGRECGDWFVLANVLSLSFCALQCCMKTVTDHRRSKLSVSAPVAVRHSSSRCLCCRRACSLRRSTTRSWWGSCARTR